MDKFLEIHNILKLNQEELECLKRPLTTSEIGSSNQKTPVNKSRVLDSFTGESHKTFKEELTPILLKLFQKSRKREDSHTLTKPASSQFQNQVMTQQRKKTISQYL